ncbi:type VI secretion system baseplate subunit TssF [Francisella uliginis]|uniref:Cadherin domain-containing protein n=1 Tax=Francisella uliginis TaxID=573570 RepID=A0A1L4BTP3_9GAMM|nr:type VI secretion system baseplate subunit TssF [Francisella uliginis]API87213.1 hypothetical protein F7310_07490 [Francisella uliginis]
MAKFQDIYKKELRNIKDLSKEFSKAHPNIAPMLGDRSTDPDVERLLEGFAYISAEIQEIIDDQLPEFSGGLIKKFFPHYLRPLPSTTLMHFKPKVNLNEIFTIKKGTYFDSIPVNGTRCKFRLCQDCTLSPIKISDIGLVKNTNQQSYIELNFSAGKTNLVDVWQDQLSLHLGGQYQDAVYLYYLLLNKVDRVTLNSDGNVKELTKQNIVADGFSDSDAILEYPSNADTTFRVLQEYFLLPEKYLRVKLEDLGKQWFGGKKEKDFSLRFYLNCKESELPSLADDSFLLHTGLAINVFDYDAKPIDLDDTNYQYRIMPDSNSDHKHYFIYNIKDVQSYEQGTVLAKKYVDVENLNEANFDKPCYEITNRTAIDGSELAYFITILNDQKTQLTSQETLSISLECSNGSLPEYLHKGEINSKNSSFSSLVEFENVYTPTTYKNPPQDNDWMWRLQSMLSLNYLSIIDADNLKNLLEFYLFINRGKDDVLTNRFKSQIKGIEKLELKEQSYMISGVLLRGSCIDLHVNGVSFSSDAEIFFFGNMLNVFFSMYATLNSFTKLQIINTLSGEVIKWPAMMNSESLEK